MSAHLGNTYGAAFIGMVIAAVLYGVSCVQALYYYTNQKDPWYIKLTVTAVLIFDTIHQALITHSIYTYLVTGWGDQAQLFKIVWSIVIQVIFTTVPAFIVQCFLTMRIWRLSSGNIYLTGIPVILAAASFVTYIVTTAILFQYKTLPELGKANRAMTISVTLLSAVTDIIIAATLCTLLHTSRTGCHKSGVIINRLIVFTVNTGLITSICALACLISVVAAGNTFVYIAFFFCLGRLYTNTLLATLNAREIIRNVNEAGSTEIFSLRDFRKNGSDQTPLSIKIDTTTQKHYPNNDQKREEKSGLSYDPESTLKEPTSLQDA